MSNSAAVSVATTSGLARAVELLVSVGLIYALYLGYGYLQEDIYTTKYGEKKEKFHFSLFLVWCQCIANGLWGLALCVVTKQPVDRTPKKEYFKIAFSYIFAMLTSNLALSYVSYPTQALAKSCKMVPVMLSRIIINKKSYHMKEYANVLLITAGISIFTLFPSHSPKAQKDIPTDYTGYLWLAVSLCLDAYTGPAQEKVEHTYKASGSQMQTWMNFFAVGIVSVGLVVTGEGMNAIAFCTKYPSVLGLIALFSFCSALGQAAIISCLFRFDSLVVTTITTTRKFFTILVSVVGFGHELSKLQWAGVGLVFVSLALDVYQKNQARGHHRARHAHGHGHGAPAAPVLTSDAAAATLADQGRPVAAVADDAANKPKGA